MNTINFADKEKARDIILALSQVLGTNNNDVLLSDEESLHNIENATIKVFCGDAIGTGLLLTEDGIFITAYHVIESYLKKDDTTYIEVNDNMYNISEVTVYKEAFDVALCYADIDNKKCKPIKFMTGPGRFCGRSNGSTVHIISTSKGTICRRTGKIVSSDFRKVKCSDGRELYECYDTDIEIVPGFSGGSVTTDDGRLIGLCLFSERNIDEKLGKAGFTSIENIEMLIGYAFLNLGRILKIR